MPSGFVFKRSESNHVKLETDKHSLEQWGQQVLPNKDFRKPHFCPSQAVDARESNNS